MAEKVKFNGFDVPSPPSVDQSGGLSDPGGQGISETQRKLDIMVQLLTQIERHLDDLVNEGVTIKF